jgi:ankyrin repeat protein
VIFFNTIHKQFLKAVQTDQQAEALKLLAQNPDVNHQNLHGDSPLLWAAKNGNRPLTEAILHAQADINLLNKAGNTALIMAVASENTEIALLLIERGADIRLTARQDQYCPIHAACGFGNIEVLRALVEKGADLEIRMSDGKTPLILASNYGHQEIAEYLIQHGADINAIDNDGNTPLIAAAKAYPGIVQILMQKDAKISTTNKDDKNAYAVAKDHIQTEVMAIIDQYISDKVADSRKSQEDALRKSGKQETLAWLENLVDQKVEFSINQHTIEGDYDSRDEGESIYTGIITKKRNRYYVVLDNQTAHKLEHLPKYCELNTQVLTWRFMTKWHVSYTYSIKQTG